MHNLHVSIAAVALVAFGAAPAVAAGTANGTAPKTAVSTPGKSAAQGKLICKRPETSGTRRTDKICLTKADWKKVDEQQ